MEDIKAALRQFIEDNFIIGAARPEVRATTTRSSTTTCSTRPAFSNWSRFLEETFGIKVDDDEMIPENLDSLDNVDGLRDPQARCLTGPAMTMSTARRRTARTRTCSRSTALAEADRIGRWMVETLAQRAAPPRRRRGDVGRHRQLGLRRAGGARARCRARCSAC